MSGLRFLMLTTFYPPLSFGGDAVGIQRLSRGLARRGHHVTVVHDADAYQVLSPNPPPAGGIPAIEDDDGVQVMRLRSSLPVLSVLLTQQIGRPVMQGRRLRALIDRGNYDVVTFHNASLIGGPGVFRYAGDAVSLYMAHEHWLVCPTHVLWRHGRELCTGKQCLPCMLSYGRPPQLWRATGFLEREIEHIDAFIAMSEFSRAKHHEFGFTRDMEVLPYFLPDPVSDEVPRPRGPRPHDRPYFFFAGRLERIKGLDDVIPVFGSVAGADLLIAGDGTHAAALKASATSMPNVRFLGRLHPDDLSAYYQHAIALIVPSVCYETFGIVLIEAFRQGVPVIARRLGPFPEIVETSGGGELFGSEAELRGAIHRFMTDSAMRDRMAAAGYRGYVNHWSEQVVVPKFLEIVRRAANRHGHQRVLEVLSMAEVA